MAAGAGARPRLPARICGSPVPPDAASSFATMLAAVMPASLLGTSSRKGRVGRGAAALALGHIIGEGDRLLGGGGIG